MTVDELFSAMRDAVDVCVSNPDDGDLSADELAQVRSLVRQVLDDAIEEAE